MVKILACVGKGIPKMRSAGTHYTNNKKIL